MLRAGGLVAIPTETVYGLGADAEDPAAVARVFQVKGRPPTHPLIVHLGAAEQLGDWVADVPETALVLAGHFWPGPLTLVLRRGRRVPLEATGGLETVAVRVPAHPVALELLSAFGGGVAAPSANRFGSVSPITAEHVRAELGDAVDFVLDGGPCDVGVESTIVDATGDTPTILRPGGVTPALIPKHVPRRTWCAVAAAAMKALLGRTTGPEAVAAGPVTLGQHDAGPSRAAVVAAMMPAVPPPSTVRSNSSSRLGPSARPAPRPYPGTRSPAVRQPGGGRILGRRAVRVNEARELRIDQLEVAVGGPGDEQSSGVRVDADGIGWRTAGSRAISRGAPAERSIPTTSLRAGSVIHMRSRTGS
ncbi:L-threonylcarbamoyladenylate synthase [Amycolatopsis sp. CA-128772]|uniref:L-threonylcarbamoyladenylate synthase n=1 Tax=Amycolatopsis sp. CA-128772 TaxID=2073159 RepID=UPI001E41DEDE